VPHWATWDHFHELDKAGLMMYGQMTAGSWIYIGAQGIVQGTFETFAEAGRQHFDGDLSGKWILTAGLGGMGGAQPLAGVLAGASVLAVECQESRIDFRLRTRYLDYKAYSIEEALDIITKANQEKRALPPRASFLPISVRCSAKVKARSAGWLSQAIRRISIRPMPN